ncbi:flavin reductase family protein, partial [Youngiibacter multivorans]
MNYDPALDNHGLPMGPFKSISVPRPIAWVSTMSKDGKSNLAPYSQYMNLTFDPPYVMLSINQTTEGIRKDTCNNIEQTGEFVINMPT